MLKKLLKRINKFNQEQWFIVSIVTTTSGVWFSLILNFFGLSLHLTKNNESGKIEFTLLGLILTIITVGWSFLCLISQRYCEYLNNNLGLSEEKFTYTETLYEALNSSSASIIEQGVLEKLSYIEELMTYDQKMVELKPIKKPCNTLKNIVSEMAKVLPKLLTYKQYNIKEKDLNINIYYNFPQTDDKKWYKTHGTRQQRGITIEELLKPTSTFFEALNSQQHYVYYNNKKLANNLSHYIIDSEDDKDLNGSIACFLYEVVNNDKVYIKFMITLSSYGKKFSKSDSEKENDNIAQNLKKQVFPEYEILIKSSLVDLYITKLLEMKKVI